jgi:hypothetical protein
MRRFVVAAVMVLAGSALVAGSASAADGCRLVSPADGAVLYKGNTYPVVAQGCAPAAKGHLASQLVVEVPVSGDKAVDSAGDWTTTYVVDDFTLNVNTVMWVRFADGSRTNSIRYSIAARP